jgi:glutathione S-transferase
MWTAAERRLRGDLDVAGRAGESNGPWGRRDDSRSQRILWLLEELGLPYQITQHKRHPRTRPAPVALKQVHLLGKSPVIEDGGRVVSESGAIIDYILRR